MQLILDALRPDPASVRTIDPMQGLDRLVASIREIGMIQPIVVRPDETPDRWLIVSGVRRVAAVRRLGWRYIEAIEFRFTTSPVAAWAADNLTRQAIHPIDQFRAVQSLCDGGLYTIARAAAALGADDSLVRQFAWFTRIDPSVLDAMTQGGVPKAWQLRRIAAAEPAIQRAALETARAHGAANVAWTQVAALCTAPALAVA